MPRILIVVLMVLASSAASLAAELKLAQVFSDHAVLQRDKIVPVWGTADAGDKITVEFAGQKKEATADAAGNWFVKLDALKANAEGAELKVSGKTSITLKDIVVGEVWVASGQSNMAFTLGRANGGKEEAEKADDPLVRWLHVGGSATGEPQSGFPGDKQSPWVLVTKTNAASCSAAAYFFAKELRRTLNVPVGVMGTHVGGTAAEQWTEKETLKSLPELKALFENQAQLEKEWDSGKTMADYEKALEKQKAAAEKSKADKAAAPRALKKPTDPRTNSRLSGLFNGKVAPLQPYAIRGAIWYQGEANGTRGAQYKKLFPAMIGAWRTTWRKPPALKTVDFGLAREDFPFIFVQLPNFNAGKPDGVNWAELREAQVVTLKTVPNTGMAVIVDIGDLKDIHPAEKKPVGARLAQAARALVYGEKVEPTGPLYEALKIDGAKAVISFKHLGGGLVSKSGDVLKSFELAGADQKFVPAEGRIEGDTVVVTAKDLAAPVAVRYAFVNACEASLFSKEGLPASPFRTDDWPLSAAPKQSKAK